MTDFWFYDGIVYCILSGLSCCGYAKSQLKSMLEEGYDDHFQTKKRKEKVEQN